MDKVIISEEKFMELDRSSGIDDFPGRTYEHIYNIISEYLDQKVYYQVDSISYLDDDLKQLYARFGIILLSDTTLSIDLDNRNYLLIVDHSVDESSLKEYCEDFVSKYLPEGKEPTHFVINKTMETYEESIRRSKPIFELYPNIMPIVSTNRLRKEADNEQLSSDMLEDLKEIGVEPLNISEGLNKVISAFEGTNSSTLRRFKELEEEILSKYTGKEVIFSSSKDQDGLAVTSAYMFYQHGISSHLGFQQTRILLSYLSSLLFDQNRMLAEDQIFYIRHLPDIMLKLNDYFQFLVVLLKDRMTCRIRMSCLPVEGHDKASLEVIERDINEITVIPLEYEYNFSTDSVDELKSSHDSLLEILKSLEAALGKFDSTVNVTNSLIIEEDGIKYIAHIEEINLNIPSVVFPVHDELYSTSVNLGLDDLRSLYPVNVFPGYKEKLSEFIKSLVVKSGYSVKSLAYYKHKYAFGVILSKYYNSGSNLLKWSGEVDFLTLGLWWDETYKYRVFLLKDLSKYIDLREFRKRSDFISIFGGPHPMFLQDFVITEDILKGWY